MPADRIKVKFEGECNDIADLTPGKLYSATKSRLGFYLYDMKDDVGDSIKILVGDHNGCAFLADGTQWEIVE